MFTTIFEINDIAIISVKGIDYCYVIYDLKKLMILIIYKLLYLILKGTYVMLDK